MAVYRAKLPPSWFTLYKLTCLDEDEWQAVEAAGLLKPDLARAGLAQFLAALKNNETAPRGVDFPSGRYATIVTDPRARAAQCQRSATSGGRKAAFSIAAVPPRDHRVSTNAAGPCRAKQRAPASPDPGGL